MRSFFHQPLDLPLGERSPTRWLGWLAAAMVGMACIATAFAAAASGVAQRAALEPVLVTVLLPAKDGVAPTDAEVDRLVATLDGVPGVAFVRPVAAAELGLGGIGAAGALPRFVDLALNPGSALDLEELEARVRTASPTAEVALGARTPDAAGDVAALVRDLAFWGALATVLALVLVAGGLTRLALVLHRDTIDLLRQLGAEDRYIARQLGQHVLTQVLRGGFLGFLGALPIILGVMALARGRLPALELAFLDWLLLGALPPAAALLARAAASLAARPPSY